MTNAANTPRTAAGQEAHQRSHAISRDGCPLRRGKPCIIAINIAEAEQQAAKAAAPTPAEPLDVERLRSDLKAEFIHNGSYNRTAVWMGFDRVLDRLAAARPEADHD
jgi:hypothetical protein